MSSKRKANREKKRGVVNNLKDGRIPNNVNKVFLLQQIKYTLSETESEKILNNLDEDSFNYVTSYPLAYDYSELVKEFGPYRKDFRAEFSWIIRFLKDYSPELNHFIYLEKQYDAAFLVGNYATARVILESIETEISASAWGMQQKLLVAEFERGFVGNKDLLSNQLSNDYSVIINFLNNYSSIRFEKNISPRQFEDIIDDYVSQVNNGDLTDYIFFKVDFFRTFDYKNLELILAIDGRMSIIDRYITFKQVCKYLLSIHSEINLKTKLLLKHSISTLSNLITDNELNVLGSLFGRFNQFNKADFEFLKLVDYYTSSEYELVVKTAESVMSHLPKSYHLILIYCKSLINIDQKPKLFGNGDSLLNQIIQITYQLIAKKENYNNELLSNAYKTIHQLGNHPLAVGLFHQLNEELPYKFEEFRQINFFKFYIINSFTINPALYQFIAKPDQQVFFNFLQHEGYKSSTVELIQQINNSSSPQDYKSYSLRGLKYLALVFKNSEQYEQSLEVYDFILQSKSFEIFQQPSHTLLDVLWGKFNCLVAFNHIGQALDLAVTSIIFNEKFVDRFYNPYLLSELMQTEITTLQSDICLPIYLSYYKKNFESYHLYVAYDNYLSTINVVRPIDMIKKDSIKTKFDYYFLDKVCTHDVLHSSPEFENQDELDLERIEICNYLLSYTKNVTEIEAERSDLLRKILIRKGIKQINYSKIYVDVISLKDSLRKDLKENFNRNVEIASLPIDQLNKIVDSVGNVLVYYVEEPIDEEVIVSEQINKVKFTSYNRYLHFKEAFLKIRDGFIADKDYGLDTYLSMRIRHGTLLGQIRSVFETHHLITVRNDIDEAYLPNEVWLSKFSNLTENELDKIDNALKDFSKAVDSIAENLKVQTIQIKTEKNKSSYGLFDYSYTENELLELFSNKFGSLRDFDLFVENVIEELWSRTELCLRQIKLHLNEVLVKELERIFTCLEFELNNVSILDTNLAYPAQQELILVIRQCRTAIIVEIGKISEWFNRSTKKIIEEFDFSVLVDSSVSTLKTVNPLFKDAVIDFKNECELIFDGDLFPYFTDMLYYLLDNAIKHSRLPSQELKIWISILRTPQNIIIVITNNILNESNHLLAMESNIKATKIKIESEHTYEHVNKEGGTGLPKIKKILKHDLKRKAFTINMNLEREESPLYTITISFEIDKLPIIT